jgi:succinate-semialdehyde dehydrogenase/glutarate-semialdehyde dehydrogenase
MHYQSINPYTEALVQEFPDHTDSQLGALIAQAQSAYETSWRLTCAGDRRAILSKAASLLRHDSAGFAALVTLEMGKLFSEAQAEVALSADILDYCARNAEGFLVSRQIGVDAGEAIIEQAPLGVLFCIEPWNFPYYQLARVVGPNLMAGNTLIYKHASNVPQCALAFEKLLLDAGAPAGACANAFLTMERCASAIADPRIRGVALTGSVRAGAAVAAEAGKALKKSTMELGGSDAFIVLDDADMNLALKWAVWGRMNNTGQCCVAAKRFILHEKIADTFLSRFTEAMQALIPGDPFDPRVTLGPLCTKEALETVLRQIEQAVASGGKLVLGGKRLDRTGFFLAPTILTDVDARNPSRLQEFFAPVSMIFRVGSDDEAIAVANDSPYGLGGSIMTSNTDRGKKMARRIDTGMVFINQSTWTAPELPFGGVKNSGYGRELSDLGIGEFVNRKLIRVA